MYSRNLFGSYYPVKSSIHSMSVVVKLLNLLLFILVMIGSTSLELHLFILAVIVLEMYESKVPVKFYFNMFYGMRYLYVILIFLFASLGFNLELSLVYLLKIVLIVENLALIIFTTSRSEFDYGIYKIINPINFLNFNIGYISTILGNIVRFIPELIITERNVLKAQASRGIDYFHSGIVGKIFAIFNSFGNTLRLTLRKMKVSNELARMKMFDIKKRKTNLRTGKFSFYAFMLLSFHILFLVGYMMEVKLI